MSKSKNNLQQKKEILSKIRTSKQAQHEQEDLEKQDLQLLLEKQNSSSQQKSSIKRPSAPKKDNFVTKQLLISVKQSQDSNISKQLIEGGTLQDTLDQTLTLKRNNSLEQNINLQKTLDSNGVNNLKTRLLSKMDQNQRKLESDNKMMDDVEKEQKLQQQLQQGGSQQDLDVEPVRGDPWLSNSNVNQNLKKSPSHSHKPSLSGQLQQPDKKEAAAAMQSPSMNNSRRQSIEEGDAQSRSSKTIISKTSKMSKLSRMSKTSKLHQREEMIKQKQKELEDREKRKMLALEQRKAESKKERIIKLQATIRMFIQKRKFKRLLKKFKILQRENRAEMDLNIYQEQCIKDFYNERGKVFISNKYGVLKKEREGDLRNNMFYDTIFNALAEHGNLDMLGPEYDNLADDDDGHLFKKRKRTNSQSNNIKQDQYFKVYQRPQSSSSRPFLNDNNLDSKEGGIVSLFLKKGHPISVPSKQQLKEIQPLNFNRKREDNNNNAYPYMTESIPLQEKKLKFDKFKKMIGNDNNNDNQEEEQEDQYSETFEKESGVDLSSLDRFKQNYQKHLPEKRTKNIKSKSSLKDSAISEEDYLRDSFDQESLIAQSIRESIQQGSYQPSSQGKMAESKISESIVEEAHSVISEDIPEKSPQRQLSHSKSSGGGIDEEIQQSQQSNSYQDEKFESVSEDIDKNQQSSSKGGNSSDYIDSPTKKPKQTNIQQQQQLSQQQFKKKQVTFGTKKQPITSPKDGLTGYESQISNSEDQYLQEQALMGASVSSKLLLSSSQGQLNQNINNNKKVQISKFNDIHQTIQKEIITNYQNVNVQPYPEIDKMSKQPQQQQLPSILYVQPELQQIVEKYKTLKAIITDEDKSQALTKEFMQIKKVEAEIQQVLNNTQKITQKWREEADKAQTTEKLSEKADFLYTKFQYEFNRLIASSTLGQKLNILGDFAGSQAFHESLKKRTLYGDNIVNIISPQSTSSKQQQQQQQEGQLQQQQLQQIQNPQQGNIIQSTLTQLKAKQEIIQQVLNQVLDNLSEMRQSAIDFSEVKQMRVKIDERLDLFLKNQEIIIKKQITNQTSERDKEIKSLLQQILQNQKGEQRKEERRDKNKLLLELLDKNRDDMYTNLFGTYGRPVFMYRDQEDEDAINSKFDVNKAPAKRARGSEMSREEMQMWLDNEDKKQQDFTFKSQEQYQKIQGQNQASKMQDDQQDQWDMEARDDRSNISWQESLKGDDLLKYNENMADDIVKYLSDVLMDEITKDLFPLRGHINPKQIDVNPRQQEYIKERANIHIVGTGQTHPKDSARSENSTKSEFGRKSPYSPSSFGKGQLEDSINSDDSQYSAGVSRQQILSSQQQQQNKDNDQSLTKYNENKLLDSDQASTSNKSGSNMTQDKNISNQNKQLMQVISAKQQSSLLKEKNDDYESSPTKKISSLTSLPLLKNSVSGSFSSHDEKSDKMGKYEESENMNPPEQKILPNQLKDEQKKIVDKCIHLFQSKNKRAFLRLLVECIKKNEKSYMPEFIGNAFDDVHIFSREDDLDDEETEGPIAQVLEDQLKTKLVGVYNEICKGEEPWANQFSGTKKIQVQQQNKTMSKEERDQKIIVEMSKRWDGVVEGVKQGVIQQFDTVINRDFYKEVDFKKFDDFYEYCQDRRAPKEEPIGEKLVEYELDQFMKSYRKDLGDDMIDLIVQNMADEVINIQKKRTHLKNQAYY